MLTTCSQCQKEYFANEGLIGKDQKNYCSRYCLQKSQQPAGADEQQEQRQPTDKPLPVLPVFGVIGLVALLMLGSMFLGGTGGNIQEGSEPVAASSQNTGLQKVELQAGDTKRASAAPVSPKTAVPAAIPLAGATSAPDSLNASGLLTPEDLAAGARKQLEVDPVIAEQLADKALAQKSVPTAWAVKAEIYLRSGRFEQAKEAAEKCLAVATSVEDKQLCHQTFTSIYNRQANAQNQNNQNSQLQPPDLKSTPEMPGSEPAVTNPAQDELLKKELAHVEELIRLKPQAPEGYLMKARILCKQNTRDSRAWANTNLSEACLRKEPTSCQLICRDGQLQQK